MIFGFAFYVSSEYKQHAQDGTRQSPKPSPTPISPATNDKTEGDVSNSEWHPPSWYRLFGWPDGVTAWGILLTLLAIAEQTSETRNSVHAVFKQVELQAIGMQQWVEVRIIKVVDTGRLQDPDTGDALNSPYVQIWIEAINQTPFPLTLEGIGLVATVAGTKEDFVFRSDKGRRLIPGQRNSSSIGYIMRLELTPIAMEHHSKGVLTFGISGRVRFVPSIGPVEQQDFDLLAKVGGSESAEFPYMVEMRRVKDA